MHVKSGRVAGVAEVAVFSATSVVEPTITTASGAMRWVGEIAPQKWMNFYTKVLSRFVKNSGLKIKVEFETPSAGNVSKQQIEETKAALRELGLNDDIKH